MVDGSTFIEPARAAMTVLALRAVVVSDALIAGVRLSRIRRSASVLARCGCIVARVRGTRVLADDLLGAARGHYEEHEGEGDSTLGWTIDSAVRVSIRGTVSPHSHPLSDRPGALREDEPRLMLHGAAGVVTEAMSSQVTVVVGIAWGVIATRHAEPSTTTVNER
jgi:hypothetical protein